jgi:hypothetical protein
MMSTIHDGATCGLTKGPRRRRAAGRVIVLVAAMAVLTAGPCRAQHAREDNGASAEETAPIGSITQAVNQLHWPETSAAPAARPQDDPKFNVLLASFITTAGADIAVSMYQIGTSSAREQAFGAWWQDQPVAFAVSKSAMTAAFVYGLQKIHRSRPKTAYTLGLIATAIETSLVVRAANMGGRPVER